MPPKSPPSTNSINLFLPLDDAPFVMGSAVGDPELPADDNVIEIIPLTASSKQVEVGIGGGAPCSRLFAGSNLFNTKICSVSARHYSILFMPQCLHNLGSVTVLSLTNLAFGLERWHPKPKQP